MGPYRSEAQRIDSHSSDYKARYGAQTMRDEINSISSLNCGAFSENCKWGNTNDDELDWTTLQALPDAERFLSTLGVESYPDPASGALTSPSRLGWEGGQLISDPLPCLPNGVRITATAWKSHLAPISEQPKLQVCSKNVNEVKFPLINCNEFDIKNGVPLTVDVPSANDPNQPAQIVFNGNNFVAPQGGAIFLQDIVLEGTLSCNGETLDSHPVLVGDDLQERLDEERLQGRGYTKNPHSTGPLKIMQELPGLEALADRSSTLDKSPEKTMSRLNSISSLTERNSVLDLESDSLTVSLNTPSTVPPADLLPIPSELFETCLELSCNPSDLSCTFWRSSGKNRWEIGSAGRITNPLTGINLPPNTAQKFLVAPFLENHVTSYTLVSESLTVPLTETVFFCFYEYIATYGLGLSVCTDRMECFYKRNTLVLGNAVDANKKWNIRCVKLPVGTYELRVIAENLGGNKGEVGFLPVRLSRDSAGQNLIC